jgi:hypothetical protein
VHDDARRLVDDDETRVAEHQDDLHDLSL